MAITDIPPERVFLRMDPSDESGSEVAQDFDLWEKVRENFDFTEVINSGSAQAVIGSHFYSSLRPWFLTSATGGAGSTITYGHNNKHQVKITSGPAAGRSAIVFLQSAVQPIASDGFFRWHDFDFPNFFLDWRFSLDIDVNDHEVWIGWARDPVFSADPTDFMVLKTVGGSWEFTGGGIYGGSGSPFAIDNNDNGVTYKSARIATTGDPFWKGYYDIVNDITKRFALKVTKGHTFSSNVVLEPFFKIKTVAGTVAGSILLDSFVQRPFSVLDVGPV